MRVVRLESEDDFDGWRQAARTLAADGVSADRVVWQVGEQKADLFADDPVAGGAASASFRVPKDFIHLAEWVVLHRDPERFSLLYALLLRVLSTPRVLADGADRHVRRARDLYLAVRRDMQKMRAFVRFRELTDGGEGRLVAWFEPEHHILRANAAFFVGRFASLRWSILTPKGSIHWDGGTLIEGPAASRGDAPAGDPLEAMWKTYYAAIFNPSRLAPGAMMKEMPKKYWKNLPETELIRELVSCAGKR